MSVLAALVGAEDGAAEVVLAGDRLRATSARRVGVM